MTGISTIRASNRNDILINEFSTHIDFNTRTNLAYECVHRWFRLRLDLVAGIYSMAAIFLSVFGKSLYIWIKVALNNLDVLVQFLFIFSVFKHYTSKHRTSFNIYSKFCINFSMVYWSKLCSWEFSNLNYQINLIQIYIFKKKF